MKFIQKIILPSFIALAISTSTQASDSMFTACFPKNIKRKYSTEKQIAVEIPQPTAIDQEEEKEMLAKRDSSLLAMQAYQKAIQTNNERQRIMQGRPQDNFNRIIARNTDLSPVLWSQLTIQDSSNNHSPVLMNILVEKEKMFRQDEKNVKVASNVTS